MFPLQHSSPDREEQFLGVWSPWKGQEVEGAGILGLGQA